MSIKQQLCHQCSQITIRAPAEKRLLREYANVRELETSANQGCLFCISLHASHQTGHSTFSSEFSWTADQFQHSKISVYHEAYHGIDLESNIILECNQQDQKRAESLTAKLGGFFADSSR